MMNNLNSVSVDLDFTGKELVSISMLARIGAAFLEEDADSLAEMVTQLNGLVGFEDEANKGLEKLDSAVNLAASTLQKMDERTVWS